jgi:hypothetical protein
MDKKGLMYNSNRGEVIIPEYGRNIQAMIQHLMEIEDRKERTEAAHFIVSVMAQMNPQAKESNDYIHKLWDHMYIISDFQLDVDGPFEAPAKEERHTHPHHIGYQSNNIKYGHYGQYIMKMVEEICKEENEEKRKTYAYSIANQMKRDYLNWNRDNVNDVVIIEDLKNLSDGRLCLPEDTKLISTNDILGKSSNQNVQQNNQKKKRSLHSSRCKDKTTILTEVL